MESAFLLVATKNQQPFPPHVERFAAQREPPGLHFTPNDHLAWLSANGEILVAAWQRAREGCSRWLVDESGGLTVIVGRWRRRNATWPDAQAASREFAAELRRVGLDRLIRESRGQFAALVVDDERAIVTGDALGLRFLYLAESDQCLAVSSRAELAAWAVTPPGQIPRRDPLAPCGLAYLRYSVGDATGFADVRLLPEGTALELRSSTSPMFRERPAPWLDIDDLRDRSVDELLDLIRDEIADELSAALALPVDTHFIDLTGGKDSRLVLAVALTAGLASSFTFRTAGPPDLADVGIATQIAGEFGLTHRSGMVFPVPPDEPHADRVDAFVAATNGTVTIGHLKTPATSDAQVRVTGMTGESLRTHQRVRLDTPRDQLVSLITPTDRTSHLDLLQPEAHRWIDARLSNLVADHPGHEPNAADLVETFLIRNRARRQRGPMDELESDFRIWPLCSPEAVRAAFALGARRRQNESVHFELISRADPQLAAIPFAGGRWPKPLIARLPSIENRPPARAHPPAEPLIAREHREYGGERLEFLRSIFASRTNPVWDVIRPERVRDALDHFDTLSAVQRQQVHGAAAAAIWLGTPR